MFSTLKNLIEGGVSVNSLRVTVVLEKKNNNKQGGGWGSQESQSKWKERLLHTTKTWIWTGLMNSLLKCCKPTAKQMTSWSGAQTKVTMSKPSLPTPLHLRSTPLLDLESTKVRILKEIVDWTPWIVVAFLFEQFNLSIDKGEERRKKEEQERWQQWKAQMLNDMARTAQEQQEERYIYDNKKGRYHVWGILALLLLRKHPTFQTGKEEKKRKICWTTSVRSMRRKRRKRLEGLKKSQRSRKQIGLLRERIFWPKFQISRNSQAVICIYFPSLFGTNCTRQ